MEAQTVQVTPEQLLKHAKKHPHTHSISTQAFSVADKDIVIHNISLKSDPQSQYQVTNYRRGLTYLQEIINFKQGPLRVARKGLRKFFDILPEYLDINSSHINTSKFHIQRKQIMLSNLKQLKTQQYIIYSTEKANGQNAQISWDQDGCFWVIGSKNKTLLLAEEQDMKYIKHKHEHLRTLGIAQMWFDILKKQNQEKVHRIKEILGKHTLIGEYCDTEKSGHIVDYGTNVRLMFYALVNKQQRQYTCQTPSKLINFIDEIGLNDYVVKFDVKKVKTYEALVEQIKKQVYRINQATLQEEGEGRVVYISAKQQDQEHCFSVFKLKTLQYRIYRKLREKLRIYFEKVRKSYDKILNKYIEQIKILIKGFQLPKPEQHYFQQARIAFQLCQNQGKSVSKFIHNKFVTFIKILRAGNITKQTFLAIVNDSGTTQLQKYLSNTQNAQQSMTKQNKETKIINKKEQTKKKLAIIIPVTIPSSGKSTVFKKIKQLSTDIQINILSSDTVRQQVMNEKMKRQKTLTKSAAYQKSRKQATQLYYKYMGQIIKKISLDTEYNNYVLLLDKNHPESAIKPALTEIKNKCQKYSDIIEYEIVGLLPQCQILLENRPKFIYPFSASYILACMKRVLSRQQHQTLQGTQAHRAMVCLGFANMFRNFSVSPYNLSKYFHRSISIPLTNQNHTEEIKNQMKQLELQKNLLQILLGTKPNSFQQHDNLPHLIELVKKWQYKEANVHQSAISGLDALNKLFISKQEQIQNKQQMIMDEEYRQQKSEQKQKEQKMEEQREELEQK